MIDIKKALEMRKRTNPATYKEIGDKFGVSAQAAQQAVANHYKKHPESMAPAEPPEQEESAESEPMPMGEFMDEYVKDKGIIEDEDQDEDEDEIEVQVTEKAEKQPEETPDEPVELTTCPNCDGPLDEVEDVDGLYYCRTCRLTFGDVEE